MGGFVLHRQPRNLPEKGFEGTIETLFQGNHEDNLWTGAVPADERVNVRIGVSVLFDELRGGEPEAPGQGAPYLLPLSVPIDT